MSSLGELVHITVPARQGEPPHPCLVLLHGRGSNEEDLVGIAPHLDPRLFIISVRAPYEWMGGWRWYELEGPGREDEVTFSASLSALRTFVAGVNQRYAIDPTRTFLLGFSQGAVMSNALLLTAPDLVAGALLLSGFQPRLDPLRIRDGVKGKPVFVAHGTFDSVLPLHLGQGVLAALEGAGLDVTYREYEMDHQVVGPELLDIQRWFTARLDGASIRDSA